MSMGAARAGALLLTCALSSTGFAALATPAHAVAPPPVITAPTATSTSNDASPVVTFTGAGTAAECAAAPADAATPAVPPAYADCVSPWTVPTLPADGSYTLSVREKSVTNDGTPATVAYTLDTVADLTVTPPSSPGTDPRPTWGISVEASGTATCSLDGASVVTCTTGFTPATDLTEGSHTLQVTATDAAGNTASSTTSYLRDITAPDPTTVTGASGTGNDSSPTWTWANPESAAALCTLSTPSGAGSEEPCSSPTSYTGTASAEGDYQLTVVLRDAAGNRSPSATGPVYTFDTTAPAAPTLTPPSSPGRSTTPTWQVSAPGGTASCQLSSNDAVLVPWTPCSGTFPATISGPDGPYTLSAVATDAVGNSSAVATSSYVLDRTAPAPPVLVTPASPASGRQPVWTVTGSEPGLTAACTVTGPTTVSDVGCSAPEGGAPFAADLSDAPDGGYTLTVTVRDAAGNSSDASSTAYLLDTTPPAAVTVSAPSSPGNDRIVTWTLTGDADAVLECRFDLATTFSVCPGSAGGRGAFTADLTGASDGTHLLTVRSRDAAGNHGPEAASPYLLDTVAPGAPTAVRVGHASPSNVPSVAWTFTAEADSTALCTLLSTTEVASPEAACSSPVTTDLSQLPDGVYTLSVRSRDAAGNLGPAASGDYTLDRTAPAGPLITTTPGSPSPVLAPVWGVQRSDAGDALECQLVGLPGSSWAACTDPVSFDLRPAASGTFTLQVRETDRAGNRSPVVSAPAYVLDGSAPVPPVVTPPLHSPDDSAAPVFHIAKGVGSDDTLTLQCTVTRFDGRVSSASPCAFGDSTVRLTGVAPRVQGLVSLSVRGLDAAGNASGTATASYVYDDVPPAPAVIRPLASDTGTSPRVTWSFGEPAAAALWTAQQPDDPLSHLGTSSVAFRCELTSGGSAPSAARSTRCASPHTELLTQSGTWTLWVWSADVAGNLAAPSSSSYTFVSRVPAVTDLITPRNGTNSYPTWTFTVPRGYSALCLLTDANDAVLAQSSCSSGRYTADLSHQPHGSYTLTVQLVNGRGDEGPYTRSTPYGYRTAAASDAVPVLPTAAAGPARHLTAAGPHPRPAGPIRLTSAAVSTAGATTRAPAPGTFITTEVPRAISSTLAQVARKPTIPLLLLAVVIGFLLLQNRIDRRDPKLVSAPFGAEPELEFGPVKQLRRGLEGGAHS